MGPTAAGKTGLAEDLVQSLPLEIISVDSALVYRGLDIGTAKPDAQTLSLAPHALIDICDPSESYSAARFREDALVEMGRISDAGRVPMLVGGTMLYFRSLESGLSELPAADPGVRERLRRALEEDGLTTLHERLSQVDPASAARIHPNDPQRILRALEVFELTGKPLSEWHQRQQNSAFPYRLLKLVLAPRDRRVLRERVDVRFREMLEAGFEDEVRGLLARPDLSPELPAMRAVGYRQMAEYIAGRVDRETMIEKVIHATRQLAKRQMTWLRREKAGVWVDPEAATQSHDLIKGFLAET